MKINVCTKSMKKKLLFITSANLATNPRLVKEIDALADTYEIDVILFRFIHWSSPIDEKMRLERKHISFTLLDVSKQNIINWVFYALLEKIGQQVWSIFKHSLPINALALSRKTIKITNFLKKNNNYDLIIAHTISALYPAYKSAHRWHIPFAFDIEDYDPGMVFTGAGKHYKTICETLYKNILPKAAYLTSASPLIGENTLQLIKGHPHHQTIINSFPEEEFLCQKNKRQIEKLQHPVKFVWFSLTISFNRGLEEFFEAAKLLDYPIEVTLIGNIDPSFEKEIIEPINNNNHQINISIHPPLQQQKLHQQLNVHDVGLAIEPGIDLNNKLAISNKIIAYAQAGLYILASNTLGQNKFINEAPSRGLVSELTTTALKTAINQIHNNIDAIRQTTNERYEMNKPLAIEYQIPTIKKLITQTIS